jgi:hypothetical protein
MGLATFWADFSQTHLVALLAVRAARFFLVQKYQSGKNIPMDHKLRQTAKHYTK